jgi:hypothetical protein
MALKVHEVAEILERWQAGDGIKALARILGRRRETIRKYVRPAREQGYGPGVAPPEQGWRAWVEGAFPELRSPPPAGDGGRELEWEEYVKLAERFKWRAEPEDMEDLRQDIIVRLAEVARRYERENRPYTRWAMVWVARFTVRRYWHERQRSRRAICLSTAINGDGEKPIELGERLADDRAIDLDAWLEARLRLGELPPGILRIARKLEKGDPLTPKQRARLTRFRQDGRPNPQRTWERKYYRSHRSQGLCVNCGEESGDFARCPRCRERARADQARYRLKKGKAWQRTLRDQWRKQGRCPRCGGAPEPGRKKCPQCLAKDREYLRRYRATTALLQL